MEELLLEETDDEEGREEEGRSCMTLREQNIKNKGGMEQEKLKATMVFEIQTFYEDN